MKTIAELDAEIARLRAEREEAMKPLDELARVAQRAHHDAHGWGSIKWETLVEKEREAFRAVVLALRPEVAPK